MRYLLWNDRLIIGLDEEYAHLFTPIVANDEVEVGDLITYFEMGDGETIGLTDFARVVHGALACGSAGGTRSATRQELCG